MKKILSTLFLTSMLVLSIQAQEQNVTVEVDFGGKQPNETFQVKWFEGMNVLTALQSCATVETYPVKEYIFVTTINGIKTEIGVLAWYYEVNDKSTGKLAFRFPVKPGDKIRWIYKKDVCSIPQQK